MVIDNHVDISRKRDSAPKEYLTFMNRYPIDRTCLFSDEPFYHFPNDSPKEMNRERLARLVAWCSARAERFLPVWRIDPSEPDALGQDNMVLNAGKGFLISSDSICMERQKGHARPGKSTRFDSFAA